MSDGERAIWNDMQRDAMGDMPDVRVLWHSTHNARRAHRCDRCNDEIAIGTKYESIGLVEDGTFRYERQHFGASHYPSGCPRIGARDRAEDEAQFERDRETFFPLPPENPQFSLPPQPKPQGFPDA